MNRELTELTKKKLVIINIAKEIGISKTAILFSHSRATIHNWIKRYEEGGLEGLQNRSRANQNFNNKMPDEIVSNILELKAKHPELSAEKIKNTLKLNCSIRTIYKKLTQFDQSLAEIKEEQKNTKKPIFNNFFVSIRKIQYQQEPESIKLPKYIILIEEKISRVTFCSFSQERTSISIAIFLEYFIEFLNKSGFANKYNFYLSGSIKLSSNDSIMKIVEKKYQYNIFKNAYISDFYPTSQKEKPYKYIYNNLFSDFSIKNNKLSLSSKTFAYFLQYNLKRLKSMKDRNLQISDYIFDKIKILIYKNMPIVVDKYIFQVDKIENSTNYFTDLFADISSNEYNFKTRQIDSAISFLKKTGLKAELKYQNKLAEDMYLSSIALAKFYIKNMPESFSKNEAFKSIILNLIKSLIGLKNIAKLNGQSDNEEKLVQEAIILAEKYNFPEQEIKLKNMLALIYSHFQDREKSLKLINYIVNNPNTNKKELLRAKINKGNYLKGKGDIITAINIYRKVFNELGDQYPKLEILVLIILGRTYLDINKLNKANLYFKKAINLSTSKSINEYDISLYDNLGVYYATIGMLSESVKYFKKTIKLATERGSIIYQYSSLGNLGNVYQMQGKYNDSISISKSILPYFQKIKNYAHEITELLNISSLYFNLKKYNISKKYTDKAIFLSDFIKDHNLYIQSLIYLMNIHIEQLDLKKIVAIQQIFTNSRNKIEDSSTQFRLKIIYYKVNFLKLLFNYPLLDSEFFKHKNKIINIFNQLNQDIDTHDYNNEEKAEMNFLYCRLYKYLFDCSKYNNKVLEHITLKIKKQYTLNLNTTTKLYQKLLSQTPNVEYSNRLSKIKSFPKI